jgi:hypothetical protein
MSKEPMLARKSQLHGSKNSSVPFGTSHTRTEIIPLSSAMEGIPLEHHDHGRREVRLSIGTMHVQVVEVPAHELTAGEWRVIQTARDSYASMWGTGNGRIEEVKEDPFDGRGMPGAPYHVWHYIATVTSGGEEDKLLTMRKVYYPLQDYQEREGMAPEDVLHWVEQHLPDDISFWEIVNQRIKKAYPLWEAIRANMQTQGVCNFSTMSRCGVIPSGVTQRDERTKEKSGITFAAIQLLAAHGHTGAFMFGQVCEEFPKKALSIVDTHGNDVVLDFSPAAQTLGLPSHQTLRLNREHPVVRQHLATFPGYWVDNTVAAATIIRLRKDGNVSKEHIQTAWERLRLDALTNEEVMSKLRKALQHEGAMRSEGDIPIAIEQVEEPIIALLTTPRYFKYLIPLEEHTALYHGVVYESGDGPYPVALLPGAWENSAKNLLRKAHEKYARESHGSGRTERDAVDGEDQFTVNKRVVAHLSERARSGL